MPLSEPVTVTTADDIVLEARWDAPVGDAVAVAVVTHPHPLYGGDLDNPVPAALARAFADAGIGTLRINFRGVGASAGTHGDGIAEQDDVRAAWAAATERHPDVPLIAAGYSFGADVVLATDPGTGVRPAAVVVVAPPLSVLPDHALAAPRSVPTLVLSPAHDQFCDPERAETVTAGWPSTTVAPIDGADHFLNGFASAVGGFAAAYALDVIT